MAKSSSSGLILLALGGAAAYYAYTQGWLSSLFGSTVATGPTPGTVPAPSTTPYVLPSNITAVPLPLQSTILSLNPAPAPAPPTAAQIAAAEASPNSIAGLLAAKMRAAGSTQAQIDAAVAALFASPGVLINNGMGRFIGVYRSGGAYQPRRVR